MILPNFIGRKQSNHNQSMQTLSKKIVTDDHVQTHDTMRSTMVHDWASNTKRATMATIVTATSTRKQKVNERTGLWYHISLRWIVSSYGWSTIYKSWSNVNYVLWNLCMIISLHCIFLQIQFFMRDKHMEIDCHFIREKIIFGISAISQSHSTNGVE
jgi:hypothetical protein